MTKSQRIFFRETKMKSLNIYRKNTCLKLKYIK